MHKNTKPEIDSWLMKHHGLDSAEARSITNEALTEHGAYTSSGGKATWTGHGPTPTFEEYPDLAEKFGLKSKESMEPFKQQDGERIQNPRTENFPTEKQAHSVTTGKPNRPRGYGSNKRE